MRLQTQPDNSGALTSDASFNRPLICWPLGDYRELYSGLIEFMRSVLETDHVPFEFASDLKSRATRPRLKPFSDPGYRHLGPFLPKFDLYMDLYCPGYAYSPDFQLFFDTLSTHQLGRLRLTGSGRTKSAMSWQAPLYNQFIADLRKQAVVCNTRKRFADWRRSADKQKDSIRELMVQLQSRRRRMLPLRVDLYYGTTAAVEADAMPRNCWGALSREAHADDRFDSSDWVPPFETRARIDSALAMQHREAFFENRKGSDAELFSNLLAYICKLETGGGHRANHFHVLFLFDARVVKLGDLDRLLSRVQDRWWRITGGLGFVFDSREHPGVELLRSQGRWVMDPIDSRDTQRVAGLEQYLTAYFAKDDFTKDDGQMLRVKPTEKARTLTMTQDPD